MMTPKEKALELLERSNFSKRIALIITSVIYETLIGMKNDPKSFINMPEHLLINSLMNDIYFYKQVKEEINKL